MIKKFPTINKLAVFNNFNWDKSVLNSDLKPVFFSEINILYGRNYSGKTTLSRILRAFEIGVISDKYSNPEFSLLLTDGTFLSQDNIANHNLHIRVFNKDFIRDNLHFLINQDENIEPFAILGDDNIKIETKIKKIEEELGSNELNSETGLFLAQKYANDTYTKVKTEYEESQKVLSEKKRAKAIGRDTGIKYITELAEPNYNINRLDDDIKTVLSQDYSPINSETKSMLMKSLLETELADVPKLSDITFHFNEYCKSTIEIAAKKIGVSDKINELLREVALNKWAKEGYELHKGKRDTCAFCGNKISDERWVILNKHFDEESKELENSIDALIGNISRHITYIEGAFSVDKQKFYSKFQESVEYLISNYKASAKTYISALKSLIEQLNNRRDKITAEFAFEIPVDVSCELSSIVEQYEKICNESNKYSVNLNKEQAQVRKKIRLHEVYNFVTTMNYTQELSKIEDLKIRAENELAKHQKIQQTIVQKQAEIQDLKRQLNDEEKGAIRINEYLGKFFGYHALLLRAISDMSTGKKQIKFEITRNNEKAFNLSEGECSLIAFCYFMAKLDDIETKGKKPIIWIDDPISSLDSNHIFFIYSIITAEIANKNNFEQLFISTHSFDLLKYLLRLNGKFFDAENNKQKAYFFITQEGRYSSIKILPKYIKEFLTEFNYLFGEIYKCASIDTIDDSNYYSCYNFGNNARKFLEIYLFYRYPDFTEERKKMEWFFGDGQVPVIFTERLTNEYSHLKGGIERASMPMEIPEINTVARLILDKLQKDRKQYTALLNSIGVFIDDQTNSEKISSNNPITEPPKNSKSNKNSMQSMQNAQPELFFEDAIFELDKQEETINV
ncbi:MAG: AAA family ATPase [Bacteroidales bacterium]|jgi:wobble nucleotide-excising tRNase|nr:AAA family ATPase [Bacteroidales bacterium]